MEAFGAFLIFISAGVALFIINSPIVAAAVIILNLTAMVALTDDAPEETEDKTEQLN